MTEATSVCGNCLHFRRHLLTRTGTCHQRPPTPMLLGRNPDGTPAVLSFWPAVADAEHCGGWQQDPSRMSMSDVAALSTVPAEGTA